MSSTQLICILTIMGYFVGAANAQLTEEDVFPTDSLLAHRFLISPNVHAENIHSTTTTSFLTWDAASGLFDGIVISYSFTHRVGVDTAEIINSSEFSAYRLFDLEQFDEVSAYRDSVEAYLAEVGIPVSALQAEAKPLQIFPNPVNNRLYIQSALPFGAEFTITIYDVAGNRMLHRRMTNKRGSMQNIPLNVSNFAEGIYLLILTDNKTTLSGKFLKQ